MHAQNTLAFGKQSAEHPLVVIKADDLLYRWDDLIFGESWNRFIQLAGEKDIRISIGIIGRSLENGTLEYFEAIRALHESGQVEFWNHGLTHQRDKVTGESEFKGPDSYTQLTTLTRVQALAQEKLGFAFTSFGSPYNHKDHNTVQALRKVPELTSWFFGDTEAELLPNQIALARSIHLEQPVHYPNFDSFKRDFENAPNLPYYILQAHPGGWDEARFEQFSAVIDFLKQRKAVFLTPTELRDRLISAK